MDKRGCHRSVLLTMLLFLLGCGNPTGPIGCTGDVTVTVSAGTSPAIYWSPRCLASAVSVLATGPTGGGIVWEVNAAGNDIAPTVRYGTIPKGATETVPAQPLTAGGAYITQVYRLAIAGDQLQEVIAGSRNFTP